MMRDLPTCTWQLLFMAMNSRGGVLVVRLVRYSVHHHLHHDCLFSSLSEFRVSRSAMCYFTQLNKGRGELVIT